MLSHLKVIDCSTVLAGPSVGTFFAELGAQVIKIEHPVYSDVTRTWKLSSEDKNSSISAYFSSVNFKKSYQNLDFTTQKDRETLLQLLHGADILLSNFKKGDAEKFQLNDEFLRKEFPQLIHGKISGFGDNSDRVAYDLILQAESGFMSMNGTENSGPVKMPVALIDILAAHQLKEGLLLKLYQREQTKQGGTVSVSLYDAALCSLANQASNFLMQGKIPQRLGSLHPNIAPYGEIFESLDNRLVTFAIGSDRHFLGLCEFLAIPEIAITSSYSSNVERVKNRKSLFRILQEEVKKHTSIEIDQAMRAKNIPFGIIKDLGEVFNEETAQQLVREEQIDGFETKRLTQIAFKDGN